MGFWGFAAGLTLCVIGQAVLLPSLGAGALRPDCFLLLVCLLTVRLGPEAATLQGFLIGLCQDALSGGPLGLRAFAYSLLGFAIARLSRNVYTDKPFAQFCFLLGGTTLTGLLTLGLVAFFLEMPPLLPTLLWVIVPEGLVTATFGLLVLWLLRLPQQMTQTR
ncbi:MAG: rod shape-determining protein MreD [candidate division NC10 bacterium]|nr:rod shape-determining protein MreD [candidate division NC10 bacterium]